MTIGLGIFYFIMFCFFIWIFTLIEKALGWIYDNSEVGRKVIQAGAVYGAYKMIQSERKKRWKDE